MQHPIQIKPADSENRNGILYIVEALFFLYYYKKSAI